MLVNSNRFPVTDEGVVIPKVWFGDATEVEIRQENGFLVISVDTTSAKSQQQPKPVPSNDPLWKLCDDPADIEITDASINLDKYLYDEPHGVSE